MNHNGVYVAESEEAAKRDDYLNQSTDLRIMDWDDERICFSGKDKDGEIFEKYWTPRPPADSYEVRTDYKPHTERK